MILHHQENPEKNGGGTRVLVPGHPMFLTAKLLKRKCEGCQKKLKIKHDDRKAVSVEDDHLLAKEVTDDVRAPGGHPGQTQ